MTDTDRPRRLVAGAIILVAAAVVVGGVAWSGDGVGRGSGCMSGLAGRLPPDARFVDGSDLRRAREAGFEDGPVEDPSELPTARAVRLDPLTQAAVSGLGPVDPGAEHGYTSADVACWVGGPEAFVARGSFDPGSVDESELGEAGEVAATAELLARDGGGDPQGLLDRSGEAPPQVSRLLAAAESHGVISFASVATDDDPSAAWAATALARGDRWELVMLWSFADARRAEEGQRLLVDILTEADGGVIGGIIDADPVDLLDRDGALVWLRAPLAADPSDWLRPVIELDPALTLGSPFDDD